LCELTPLVWWRYIDDIFMIWQHGEEKLKDFISQLNSCHPSIKFTVEYSFEKINFLDVAVTLKEGKLITDLYVKDTDTHQYLDASSCHVFHCKKAIPYSQALRLNRICSEGKDFDKRCNDLESWLKSRGYSDKLVRNQILRARKFSRNDLLNKESKRDTKEGRLILNITYHPALSKLKSILSKIHILLSCDREHKEVFNDTPIVGFKNGKSLKQFLVRAKLPDVCNIENKSSKCRKSNCKVCMFVEERESFEDRNGNIFKINGGVLDCNSKNVVYLVNCKTCNMQYVGSTSTAFRLRLNNYKSHYKKYINSGTAPQAFFHEHFSRSGHNGSEDWSFVLIDKGCDIESVRRKESFWQYRLDSFSPNGLNLRNVTLDF